MADVVGRLGPLHQQRVGRDDHSSFAGGHGFVVLEAEDTDVAECS